jgi:hypothetical protein
MNTDFIGTFLSILIINTEGLRGVTVSMLDIYRRYLRGEKFKGIEDINIRDLPVKHPADLVANSSIMQKMALKYSRLLKNKELK